MAKPIKETPVLKGQDAKNFLNAIENSDKNQKVSQEAVLEMKINFEKMMAMAKFLK